MLLHAEPQSFRDSPCLCQRCFSSDYIWLAEWTSDLSSEQNQPVLLSCQCVCWLRPQAQVCPPNKSCDVSAFDAVGCWCAPPVVSQANDHLKLCSAQSLAVWALATRPPSDFTPDFAFSRQMTSPSCSCPGLSSPLTCSSVLPPSSPVAYVSEV